VDNKPFRMLALAGSLRQGSYNRGLLRAAEELAPEWVEVQFFDIAPYPISTKTSKLPVIPRWSGVSRRPSATPTPS